MAMTDNVLKDLKGRIDKTIEDLKRDLSRIRTGRANPSMLEGVRVNYYGTPTPLAGVASVNVPEPRLITLKPYDKSAIKEIEKALNEANLGVTPQSGGELIRLSFPPMTEERRKEVAKQVKAKGEEHKVAVRNIRRDANEALKALQKDKKITEDDLKRATEKVQKETDAGIARVAMSGGRPMDQLPGSNADLLFACVTPYLDAAALCRSAREAAPRTAVILVYPPGQEDADAHATAAGADSFIAGPLQRAPVAACVRSSLQILELRETVQRLQARAGPHPRGSAAWAAEAATPRPSPMATAPPPPVASETAP